MRRIALWFAGTVTVVTLLFGYHTSTEGVAASGGQQPVVASSGPATQSASTTSDNGSTKARATPKATSTKSYTGQVAQTAYGPVQVAVEVSGGEISKVSVVQYPHSDPRDTQINSYALPILVDETVKAGDAQIQMVSGATYTSAGYQQSLQSALDQAGI